MVCMSALEQSSVNMSMEEASTVATTATETPPLVISKTTSKTLMDADEKNQVTKAQSISSRSTLDSKDDTVIIVSDSEDSLSGIIEEESSEDSNAEEFEEVSDTAAKEREVVPMPTSAGLEHEDDEYLMSTSNHSRIIKKTHSLPDFPTLLGSSSNHESPKVSVPKNVKVSRSKSETASENHQVLAARRSVTFGVVNIREYDLTLGDHPDCTFGPPMSLDWDYQEVFESSVEYYETNREPRRRPHQMIQNYFRRKNILMACAGFSEKELKKATKEVERAKFKRNLTKTFLPAWKVEDALESAARKTKRAVTRKNKRSSSTTTKKSVHCQADV